MINWVMYATITHLRGKGILLVGARKGRNVVILLCGAKSVFGVRKSPLQSLEKDQWYIHEQTICNNLQKKVD